MTQRVPRAERVRRQQARRCRPSHTMHVCGKSDERDDADVMTVTHGLDRALELAEARAVDESEPRDHWRRVAELLRRDGAR